MYRRLVTLALCAGCGNVDAPPSPDAPPPPELLTGTLRTGCVVALHMDEPTWTGAAGEIVDDCGNDNPGTLSGQGTTTIANGVRGRAGSFSGGACIEIPDGDALHGTTGLTLSAWILPTKLNNSDGASGVANGVISKRRAGNDQAEYSLSVWTRNHVFVDLDGETDRFEGATAIAEQVWTQITLVYDGTRATGQRARVYLNGTVDITKGESSAMLARQPSTLHIGCMPAPTAMPPTQQNFIGQLDEVVIWNRALTDEEIATWYGNTKP